MQNSVNAKSILEIVEDVIILNLSSLSRVLFFFSRNIIGLEPKGFEADQGFAIKFLKDKISDFSSVRKSLIDLLGLEFIDGKMGYVEIYQTKLFNMVEHPFESGGGTKISKLEKWVSLVVAILCLIGGLYLIILGVTQLSFGGLGSWILFVFLVPLGALVLVVGLLVLRKLRKEISRNK